MLWPSVAPVCNHGASVRASPRCQHRQWEWPRAVGARISQTSGLCVSQLTYCSGDVDNPGCAVMLTALPCIDDIVIVTPWPLPPTNSIATPYTHQCKFRHNIITSVMPAIIVLSQLRHNCAGLHIDFVPRLATPARELASSRPCQTIHNTCYSSAIVCNSVFHSDTLNTTTTSSHHTPATHHTNDCSLPMFTAVCNQFSATGRSCC